MTISRRDDASVSCQSGARLGDWALMPLLLIPIACCAVPLLAGAVLGAAVFGGTLAALAVACVAIGMIVARRRRCAADKPCAAPESSRAARTGH
jgi:hypothetical protein